MQTRLGIEAGLTGWTSVPFSVEAIAAVFAAGSDAGTFALSESATATWSGTAGGSDAVLGTPSDAVMTIAAGLDQTVPFQAFWDFDGGIKTETESAPIIVDGGGSSGTATDITFVAGTNLSGHHALMFAADGTVIAANPSAPGYVFAGISTSAATAGSAVDVVEIGPITEVSWSWTPLAAIFVGTAGSLTQTPPQTGTSHLVGYATGAQTMVVAPQTPVALI